METENLKLVAHLMRRAGFGVVRAELETLATTDYREIVEDLLHPERFEDLNEDLLKRYLIELSSHDYPTQWGGRWIWRMINTRRPLEEKMTLFWHHVFATAFYKSDHNPSMISQNEMFRRCGMTDLRTILIELAKDPAMNYWLDNCENHAAQPNENWGRELLELFSLGVGNYTEDDIKEAARAFTGWTFKQPAPLYPFGNFETSFQYIPEDHDDGEKTFLGHTGRFNGEDIVDIIVGQRAAAVFFSRHLYNFFVADEPQVSSWNIDPPGDPEAIEVLVEAFEESGGKIRPILRTLFNSEFFKAARFKKVKNPVELITGTVKLAGTYTEMLEPSESVEGLYESASVMGQALMNPPTVEGWHTGHEWIDGGTLNERVNFAVNQFYDTSLPFFHSIVDRLGQAVSPGELVDNCLEFVGPLEVESDTRTAISAYADKIGVLDLSSEAARQENAEKIARMLQLIVASREYQFA